MKTQSTFTVGGWNFGTIWLINGGVDYPKLSSLTIFAISGTTGVGSTLITYNGGTTTANGS